MIVVLTHLVQVYLTFSQERDRRSIVSYIMASMSSNNSKMISILNNDDHPSFAVRPSTEQLAGMPCTAQNLHLWSSAVERSPESPDSSAFRPIHNNVITSSVSPGRQYTRHPSFHHTNPPSQPYSQGLDRLSIESIIQKDHHSHEPLSPTSFSSGADFKAPKPSKKNKYPCPYAASHSCSATFTTSGHAARHGKKHTGEKSVHCPVCNKAFTRKDNMKQHRRTHRESDVEKELEINARSQTSMLKSNPGNGVSSSMAMSDLDVPLTPLTDHSRRHSSRSSTNSHGFPPRFDINEVSGKLTQENIGRPSPNVRSDSLANGLDSLAIAAGKTNRTR